MFPSTHQGKDVEDALPTGSLTERARAQLVVENAELAGEVADLGAQLAAERDRSACLAARRPSLSLPLPPTGL